MTSVSVVVPVLDGERHLAELLAAVAREGADEAIVIDSGSSDRSVEIARAAGAEVIEIERAEFGHGRTRNLGAERSRGELICFLTQDATPVEGWLEAHREALALEPRVGVAFGPHLPRPETSPMIARELEDFFARFSPNGAPQIKRDPDGLFLSNVNACYRRACWEEVRFSDLAYAEDQAFARDAIAAGWLVAYHPRAAVLHAHDYGPVDFMRRYFDEYRGLSEIGHSFPPFRPLATARTVAHAVRGDRRWLARHGVGAAGQARWVARSLLHHSSRDVFAALGASSERLPAWARRRLSLEGREAVARPPVGEEPAIRGVTVPALGVPHNYGTVARLWREGPAPLRTPVEGMADRDRLRIALVVPTFTRGSGGHNVLFQILARLERRGHVCSVWVVDLDGRHALLTGAVLRHDAQEFAPLRSPVHKGFDHWSGADVVVATGWQTVHPALLLPNCRARAYLVNDHEPEFFPASAEQLIAEDTYRHGLHCICGSPWLRDLLAERYGVTAEAFDYGVDHRVYRPRPVKRRRDTVIYYARDVTPRRAVPIGLLALEELRRRRPDVRIVLYGQARPVGATFPYEHAGLLDEDQLATLYSEATVGLCLSLTNFSLAPPEMMACGLPVVELAGASAESIFGADGPIELAPPAPTEIAARIERLLDDRELWQRRSEAGVAFAAERSWDRAAEQVEQGLRNALRRREEAYSAPPLGPG